MESKIDKHQINIITNPSTNQTTTQSNTSQHITAQQTPSYNTHSILSAHSRHLQADMHYCLEKDIHNIYTSNIVVQSFNSKLTPGKRQINTWQQHTESKRSNTQNRRHHIYDTTTPPLTVFVHASPTCIFKISNNFCTVGTLMYSSICGDT